MRVKRGDYTPPLAALEQGQFPAAGDHVVPYHIGVSIVALHLEVAMVGSQPAVEDLVHDNAALPEREGARRFSPRWPA